jgi:16S rRNA (cytidine1402-2'-O)-methyltransferase
VSGKLFLVATPIGNLSDITLRALEVLREVPCIAAEDTRRTRALLSHFGVAKKQLISCDAHAGPGALAALVARLTAGEDVALVTDAGTSSVSDPGTELVQRAAAAGISVVPIPGVSAVTAAVAASGLVQGAFTFIGFPPRQGGKRRDCLERIATSIEPTVLFESPHRLSKTLADLAQRIPERQAVICRELTKLHEEILRGTLAKLAEHEPSWRGEITLIVAAAEEVSEPSLAQSEELELQIEQRLAAGESPRGVIDALSANSGLSRRDVYRRVMARHQLGQRGDE